MVKWKSCVWSKKLSLTCKNRWKLTKKEWEPHKERINIRSFLYGWFGLRSHLRSIFSKNVRNLEKMGPKISKKLWKMVRNGSGIDGFWWKLVQMKRNRPIKLFRPVLDQFLAKKSKKKSKKCVKNTYEPGHTCHLFMCVFSDFLEYKFICTIV